MATEAQLTDRIQRIKAALLALGDLRPGALSEQYNTCRTPGCRCKADPLLSAVLVRDACAVVRHDGAG